MLELYPRSEIVIVVHIVQSDGSILATMINAVAMALMDAGIMMKDIITACSIGKLLLIMMREGGLMGYCYRDCEVDDLCRFNSSGRK